jgi:soluble lytic murein transglycosylase-like protein
MRVSSELNAILRRIAEIDPDPRPADGENVGARRADASRFDDLIAQSSGTWRVDNALVKAVVANESAFDPGATSVTGARGLMQLEPETARDLGVMNAYDPAENLNGGTRYLRGLLDRFHGNVTLAVAAYNAGPGTVEKYGGVPPYAETRAYVDNVLESYRRYKQR